ncbi:MAG TPA: 4Fe-4S binding protein [bacterium]|nr:4Fe-4S binding protein [bacterium]
MTGIAAILQRAALTAADIQRFPPPDFESGYTLPLTTTPAPRDPWLSGLDGLVLFAALSVGAYLVHIKRSRLSVFLLMVFSLLYFGFYRLGCVCAIGSIQNVSLAIADPSYAIPLPVVAFFLFPLAFTLFFGRVFCAGVCPLGAIQDLVLIKPIAVPVWLQPALGLLAYLYLGAAVLFAAMGSAFIICEYDPFIAFFRLNGNLNIVILGVSLLVIGLFVGRPYCRFLCPYGVILRHFSRLSHWRVTITPQDCHNCQICEESCPFGAINPPASETAAGPGEPNFHRLIPYVMLAPLLVALCGWVFTTAGGSFSKMDYTVRLAERIVWEDTGQVNGTTDASKAFRDSGEPKEALLQKARQVRDRYVWAGWFLGTFFGLVLSGKLIRLSLPDRGDGYEADRGDCLACARCFSYCPQERKRRRTSRTVPAAAGSEAVTES